MADVTTRAPCDFDILEDFTMLDTVRWDRLSCSLKQERLFCGPEKEDCVANQTLKDISCLVPCSGLYADIADDSSKRTTMALEQNVMKGVFKKFFFHNQDINIRFPIFVSRVD